MNEHDWVAHVRRRFGANHAAAEVGIGDDAAVLALGSDGRVVSVDAAVEGVHFRRDWASAQTLGHRAYVASLSDLAAMGARPVAGFFSVIAPADGNPAWLRGAIDGVAEAAEQHGAPILGGNFSNGPLNAWSFTVVGQLAGAAVRRDGAEPGDGVFVTGPVGAAALGWRVLAEGGARTSGEEQAVERWRHPQPRFDWVERLSLGATAAIDISDGLAADLAHIARASGVTVQIETARLPLLDGFREAASARGHDPVTLALGGGEDYELAFTAPLDSEPAKRGHQVGRVVPGNPPVVVLGPDGETRSVPEGHRHLSVSP
ncbi:MAG: thiamine-phosphate kinase [Sandaracinaceae bacterium]